MGKLYHGSSQRGITRLEPHKSAHGNFVYATPYKELAIIFSARCGDDYTYDLYRKKEDEPWIIVERIPEAFNTMFSNSSSIYTLDDTTFKNIHTGFAEVVSEVGVNTNSEEYINSVYDAIKKLATEGKVQLYNYPNKPKDIPVDNSDLIDKQIRRQHRNNLPVTKKSFERLILLHPYLIDKVNKKMEEIGLNVKPYQKEDLIRLFENAVIKQAIYPENEQYLKSIVTSISNSYPELLQALNEKISFLDKSKSEKISLLINNLSVIFQDIPTNLIEQAKEIYSEDNRSFSEIGKEILEFSKKVMLAEQIVNSPINKEITNNSILLIGPMGTGKSTVSKKLNELTGFSIVSLDDQEQLSKFYEHKNDFKNFKDFEFYLTSSVLTSINEPTIIDFGAGHSVYENPIMFYEMQKLIKKFQNVELMLPSESIDETLKILNQRMISRDDCDATITFDTNKHFIENHCNYELATDIVYTHNMTPEEIANVILNKIQNKKVEQNETIKK